MSAWLASSYHSHAQDRASSPNQLIELPVGLCFLMHTQWLTSPQGRHRVSSGDRDSFGFLCLCIYYVGEHSGCSSVPSGMISTTISRYHPDKFPYPFLSICQKRSCGKETSEEGTKLSELRAAVRSCWSIFISEYFMWDIHFCCKLLKLLWRNIIKWDCN